MIHSFLMRNSWPIRMAVVTAVLALSVLAIASWLATDEGPGGGRTGTVTIEVLSPAPTDTSTPCFPGSTCPLKFRIDPNGLINPRIVSIAPGDNSANNSTNTGCPASMFTVRSLSSLSVPLDAQNMAEVPAAVLMSDAAGDECQNTLFSRFRRRHSLVNVIVEVYEFQTSKLPDELLAILDGALHEMVERPDLFVDVEREFAAAALEEIHEEWLRRKGRRILSTLN